MPMFARFPHLTDSQEDPGERTRHRIEWHSLLARLDAERDLRASLDQEIATRGMAALMAEGSFDPRAAEMLFSLAAGAHVEGDMPERRFSPEDLARLSQAISNGEARLPDAKPSEAKNEIQAQHDGIGDDGDHGAAAPVQMPGEGNVSRT